MKFRVQGLAVSVLYSFRVDHAVFRLQGSRVSGGVALLLHHPRTK